MLDPKPRFLRSAAELRRWLAARHARAGELWIGFYKKASGRPGITYQEALDEALCLGWIDGVRKSLDATRWTIRFTPRTPRSAWSAVNIRRVGQLGELGRMKPAGLAAFARRDRSGARRYAYENRPRELTHADQAVMKANPAAWDFFRAQPPSYRRTATWWLVSAKLVATRQRRLATLIDCSAKAQRLPQLIPRRPR